MHFTTIPSFHRPRRPCSGKWSGGAPGNGSKIVMVYNGGDGGRDGDSGTGNRKQIVTVYLNRKVNG